MEKLIAREEIENLLKEIENEMDELEQKLGKTVQFEKAQKEEHLLDRIDETLTAAAVIERSIRVRQGASSWQAESPLALNASFYS
ncbi:hypothetical protein GKZ89_01825 [Bacillus mangrovi]|uniref:Uncharacterized protein n=1 Tax=Metabacillus mangrovi TaxID=1491830 RepID=A0A7X2S1P3_9BACI|nr:DUF5446 family protein [Metabacillus mangrovi]MTH52127.1 hypothetical protein [Metabacillus mangrovi]